MIIEGLVLKEYLDKTIYLINIQEDAIAEISDIEVINILEKILKVPTLQDLTANEIQILSFLEKEMLFRIKNGIGNLDFRKGDLDEIDLLLTNRCNLSCKHCYLECSNNSLSYILPLELLKDIIQDAKKLGAYKVTLSGGEPLLYPYLEELLDFLAQENIHIHIISNGLLIEKKLDAFKGKPISFTISLDGFKEAHEFLRGNNTFDKTLSNIKLLIKEGFNVSINTVLYTKNIKAISDFEKFLQTLGIKDLTYQVLRLKGRGTKLKNFLIKDRDLLREIHKTELLEEKKKIEKGIVFCNAFTHSLTIRYDGNVLGCESLQYIIGNIFNEKLSTIYFRGLKKNPISLVRENFEKTACSKCSLFKETCAGGCRARALKATGDIYECDLWIKFLLKQDDFISNYPVWNFPVI